MAFLGRAVLWFQKLGIRVEEVLTDNGSYYVSHAFQGLCHQLGLRHLRTRPYRPQTNGKAERLIQTLLREWPTASPTALQATVFAGFAPGFTSIIIIANIRAWVVCLLSADFHL